MQVISHSIDVIEETGESCLDGVGPSHALVGKGVYDDADTFLLKMDIDVFTRHHRVAVVVYYARS